jgi:hypothetical protein
VKQKQLERVLRLTEQNRAKYDLWLRKVGEEFRAYGEGDNLGYEKAWREANRAYRAMRRYARAQQRAVKKLDAMPDGVAMEF